MTIFASFCKHAHTNIPAAFTTYCSYAGELLVKFVNDAQVLYGNDIMVHNVHCLIHLANDVKIWGAWKNSVHLSLRINWAN